MGRSVVVTHEQEHALSDRRTHGERAGFADKTRTFVLL